MNIRISADSTCDLSPELIEKYDIRITPLYIVRDGQSLVDGKDITPDEIYAHVNSGGGMCSTAAVSVEKKGFPVPQPKMTTRPFSRCRMARERI